MPIVTTKEMFRKAYEGGYAVGAFNVNNMEIVQGITEAAAEVKAPAARVPMPTTPTSSSSSRPPSRRPVFRSPCIWTTATALSSAKAASTAASPPS